MIANSGSSGGGMAFGTAINTILLDNHRSSGQGSNYWGGTLSYCCTVPMASGIGNITADPHFVDGPKEDFRLQIDSPCVDTGTNCWQVTYDIEGLPRPLDGNNDGVNAYDIGACERLDGTADSDGDGLSDTNELFLVGTDPNNPDSDGDGVTDGDEFVADTDPLCSTNYLAISGIDWIGTDGCKIWLYGSTERVYTLQYASGLVDIVWTAVPGATDIIGAGSERLWLNDTNALNGPAFYRVKVAFPPE